ncbi:MAG TPA: NAD-dependent epimerase/dehydratase family protein [Streptosporangiaceae bacterium]|nr:NAD-dependent epimerase/dehydratase family protein [Streptosporangiaceae bacterium]
MRILVIGGTAFVGRHITTAALDAGHEVTLFHRGRTGAGLFPQATHLSGDRNADLTALASGRWDATIDVSAYVPRQVRSLAATLGERAGHYVFISSVSAYATTVGRGYTEDAALAEPPDPDTEEITEQTYGGLKVACERAAAENYGDAGLTIVRPTYVVGPHDRSYRFTWWVERIARGGTVLAPGDPADPIQVIDARDMASWIVTLASLPRAGTFHAVSPAPPFGFGDMLEAIAAEVAPPGTELTWVGEDFLLASGESWESLPLWSGGEPDSALNAADPSAAYAAGLAPRPLRQSIAETHAAEAADPTPPPPGTGLSPDREVELLARWRSA